MNCRIKAAAVIVRSVRLIRAMVSRHPRRICGRNLREAAVVATIRVIRFIRAAAEVGRATRISVSNRPLRESGPNLLVKVVAVIVLTKVCLRIRRIRLHREVSRVKAVVCSPRNCRPVTH
jgi:hypothetical protein